MDKEEARAVLAWADAHIDQLGPIMGAMRLFNDAIARNDFPHIRELGPEFSALMETVKAGIDAPTAPSQWAAWNHLLSLAGALAVAATETTADSGPVVIALFQIGLSLTEMGSLVDTARAVIG